MKIFIILSVVFVGVIIGLLFYQGIFYPVKLQEQVTGDYWVVYQGNIGPYEKVGTVIEKICNNLKTDEVETPVSFGIYYDNPSQAEKAKLRSEVGAVLSEKYYSRIQDLQSKYNIKQTQKRNSIVAQFPLRNILSYMIGPMKVYPAMEKYCKNKKIDIKKVKDGYGLELYDLKNKKITYILPIE